ncbi:MAG: histidine triad nucleotide-binding protein [Candidatus Methanoperedens sp.]|nr:histidine triad nucleotide-binding protein [Candidatus Methanoperedens sp.]
MTRDCIFCRIIKGEAPANFVYKDEDMVVFHDTRPKAPVHVLIVPVEHIESLNVLEERHSTLIAKIMHKMKEIAKILGIAESGYKVIVNVGRGGGQIIFHLHMHLMGGWGKPTKL